jgi:hypothetical protein
MFIKGSDNLTLESQVSAESSEYHEQYSSDLRSKFIIYYLLRYNN